MFPYPRSVFSLFGFQLNLFPLLVGTAIAVGIVLMDREMDRLGIARRVTTRIFWWILLWALIASHFVALFVYHPRQLSRLDWLDYLNPLNGMSSTGGFLGAAASFLFMKRWIAGRELEVADAAIRVLIPSWVVARLGCTFAFDHPGALSNFFLAFDHPAGGPRHNMGFEEMLFTLLILLPASWWLRRKEAPPGSQVAMACLLYGPARFGMDFLRATDLPNGDVRYFGLTFAQYACVFFTLAGAWLAGRIWRRTKD